MRSSHQLLDTQVCLPTCTRNRVYPQDLHILACTQATITRAYTVQAETPGS